MHCLAAKRRWRSVCPLRLSAAVFVSFAALSTAVALPPVLPTIPPGSTNILNFGAVGDGVTTNTTAIQNAINRASAVGIGTVQVPAGTFLSGPIAMTSSLNLQLDAGATLLMLPFSKYPGGDVSPANFITGSSLHDIEISGTGVIEGQGLPWWKDTETNAAAVRPNMINLSACSRVLIQDITLSNSPSQVIVIKGRAGNVTVQRVNVYAPSSGASPNPSHNTDALDLAETNALVRDCIFSTGDDNVAVGSSASASSDILITNCTFGFGHGVSIGSFTSGGVSNMTVINCTFTNTDQGIRIKSDVGRGGVVQNIGYYNITMGNVQYPILIYCSYTTNTAPFNSLNNITPALAATFPSNAPAAAMPQYRNITISNVVGTAQAGRQAGLIWGRPELQISNLTMSGVQITGSKTLGVYCVQGMKFQDSAISVPAGVYQVSFYNAGITFTNSAISNAVVTVDGVSTNTIGNSLGFYNGQFALKNTNALDVLPVLGLSASTFTISNHVDLDATSQFNYTLGTAPATLVVRSNLALAGTINVSAGAGFTNATYTLMTYSAGGLKWNSPALGVKPAGYNYSFDTNTAGQLKLVVMLPTPLAPTNLLASASNAIVRLTWSASTGATGYNVKRSLTNGGPYVTAASGVAGTNYNDTAVSNSVTYYYVVSAVAGVLESTNTSPQAVATPNPSLAPALLSSAVGDNTLFLSWPADHSGWQLQIQTNAGGLGTNWVTVPASRQTNQISFPLDPSNPSVFLRLAYP
jgi:polygalacturonase